MLDIIPGSIIQTGQRIFKVEALSEDLMMNPMIVARPWNHKRNCWGTKLNVIVSDHGWTLLGDQASALFPV